MSDAKTDTAAIENGVRSVREGPAANCSSIGSVVDTLFVTATIGGALFAAIAAALASERVTIVGENRASVKTHHNADTIDRDDEDNDASTD